MKISQERLLRNQKVGWRSDGVKWSFVLQVKDTNEQRDGKVHPKKEKNSSAQERKGRAKNFRLNHRRDRGGREGGDRRHPVW